MDSNSLSLGGYGKPPIGKVDPSSIKKVTKNEKIIGLLHFRNLCKTSPAPFKSMRFLSPYSLITAVFLSLMPCSPAEIRISEFMALNVSGREDEDGDFSDWIEISSDEAVSLTGYTLSDDPDEPKKWTFPGHVNVPAGGHVLVYASGKNKGSIFTKSHTNFKLSRSGEHIILSAPDGNVVHAIEDYPKQYPDISSDGEKFMTEPTPEAENAELLLPPVADVEFSLGSATFTDSVTVEITAPGAPDDAIIQVTQNGDVPVRSLFTRYGDPITLQATAQIRARVFYDGHIPSETKSETYLKLGEDYADFSSDLPIMVVERHNEGGASTTRFSYASWLTFEPDGKSGRATLANKPDLALRSGVRVRGSSTAGNAKSSLAIESWQEDIDEDRDVSILGMPAESDWILSGRLTFDRALIRNPLLYELSRQAGTYAPRTRFVELFINNSGDELTGNDYYGVYALIEKIKRGPDRVDVQEIVPGRDSTGGFMWKVDRPSKAGSDVVISAGGQSSIVFVTPEKDEVTDAQRNYAVGYLTDMSNAIRSDDPENPETGYRSYLDAATWIDEHILRVLSKDPDGLRLSTYFYKPRGRPVCYGPIWDFDRTMGCDQDSRAIDAEGWSTSSVDFFTYTWWGRLLGRGAISGSSEPAMPDFWQDWIDRWADLRTDVFTEENVNSVIDSMAAEIREAQVRNFERWTARPNGGEYDEGVDGWEGEIQHLKGWIKTRMEWIDDELLTAPTLEPLGGVVEAGTEIAVKQGGSLFVPYTGLYTLDGTDPRLSGGETLEEAVTAGKTITINETSTVFLRSQAQDSWSAPVRATFVVGGEYASPDNLLVSEIHYRPLGPTEEEENVGCSRGSFFEFIELSNIGDKPVYLGDLEFSGAVEYKLRRGEIHVLAPDEQCVLVSDRIGFEKRYGADISVAGVFEGNLDNNGETLVVSRLDETIHSIPFARGPGWPESSDDDGFSLTVRAGETADLSAAESWQASSVVGGTPGAPDHNLPPAVLVNEIIANSGPDASDAVELFNPGTDAVEIGGWYLTDDPGTPEKHIVPNGTSIPAGGYLVIEQDNDNDPANNDALPPEYFGSSFGLSSDGDEIYLFSANENGDLTGWQHGFRFRASETGQAFIRHTSSDGREDLVLTSTATLGAVNAAPLVGPVIFSEVMYHPLDGEPEFIEIRNVSGQTVPLTNPDLEDTPWRVSGAGGYEFPTGTELAADGLILLVENDPAAFRAARNIPAEIPVLGPLPGRLGNGGETLRIEKPIAKREENGESVTIYLTIDQLDYDDSAPWPGEADGQGFSLERVSDEQYGDDPAQWSAPTLGGSPGGQVAQPMGGIDDWLAEVFDAEQLADPNVSGLDADPDGDGRNNLMEYYFLTYPTAADLVSGLPKVSLDQDGFAELRLIRRREAEVAATVEASSDLQTWTVETVSETTSVINATSENVVLRLDGVRPEILFLRLRLGTKE